MALEKVETSKYLDAGNLNFFSEVEALALLIDARVGWSEKMGSAFHTYYFRDSNGEMVVGRRFNVGSVRDASGYDLATMKRRPVKIKYQAQLFNGLSLVVSEIKVYNEPDFDFTKFDSGIPDAKGLLFEAEMIAGAISNKENVFSQSYATDSYIEFCNGKAGGYAKFIHMVLNSARTYEGLPGFNTQQFYECLVICLNLYENFIRLKASV